LSGSFARGEGGAYFSGQEIRTTSDLDLIAVYRGPDSLIRAALARRSARKLAKQLSRNFPRARLDLTTRPAFLLRWPATTLDYHELLRSARLLHGELRLPPPSEVRIDDIPPGEITRQLRKRGAGLLLSWAHDDRRRGAQHEYRAEPAAGRRQGIPRVWRRMVVSTRRV
jgi:hypothetical protein